MLGAWRRVHRNLFLAFLAFFEMHPGIISRDMEIIIIYQLCWASLNYVLPLSRFCCRSRVTRLGRYNQPLRSLSAKVSNDLAKKCFEVMLKMDLEPLFPIR